MKFKLFALFLALRRFTGEFGTDYMTTSKLGTRIVVERRYSVRERTSSIKVNIGNISYRMKIKMKCCEG